MFSCPVPLCTYKNKHRKLKCLHHKWDCLTLEQKESLQTELGITEAVTKACANCYNRITQLLDPEHVIGHEDDHTSSNSSSVVNSAASAFGALEEGGGASGWTAEEEEKLQSVLKSHGCDWERLAAAIPTKSDKQLKNFYLNNRHKFDQFVFEWSKTTVSLLFLLFLLFLTDTTYIVTLSSLV